VVALWSQRLPDFSWMLLAGAALMVVVSAVRIARAPWVLSREWWLVLALVVALGGLAQVLAPRWAGHVAMLAVFFLVILPLRLDGAAQRATFRGDDSRAIVLAGIARLFHPIGLVGRRSRSLAAAARVRDGAPLDQETLADLGADHDPVLAEAYRLVALAAAGDHRALVDALSMPSRRHRFLALGLGTSWLRAIAATGTPALVLEALDEIERFDPSVRDVERRAALALEACAALGDVAGVQALAASLGARRPPGTFERALVQAQRVAGDRIAARATLEQALARTDLRPAQRRALERLARPQDRDLADPPARDPDVRARLDRLRHEVMAGLTLEPLTGDSPVSPWLTYGLCGALIALHALRVTDDGLKNAWAERFALRLPISGIDEAPRLLTYAAIHAGWEHLLLNVAGLWLFGRFVEAFYGRWRTAAIWIVASVTGGLGAALFATSDTHALLEGASGAIFGLGGGLLAALALRRELRSSRRGRQELLSFLALFAVQSIVDRLVPQISGAAHMFGLLGGFLAAALLMPRAPATA
jgi:rhomboid protease GluP